MSTSEETRVGFYFSEDGEWVPDGWNRTNWEDEITLNYGKAIKGYQEKQSGYPVYGTNGPIGYHEEKLFDGPAVILGRKGANRGVEYSESDFWVVDTAYGVEPKNENHPKWLYYKLIADKIGEIDDGSPIPSTPRAFVYATEVNIPSPSEQKAIAAVLGSLDDKIELLREQNETLEALAQTLFKRWFIDFNFPDENGNPYKDSGGKMVASELGEIPEGWKADKLDGYISISGGGTPSTKEPSYWDGGIAWSSPKDLSDRPDAFLFETNKTITTEGLGAISSGLNSVGSLLLSSRAPIGYIAFSDIPVAVNQGYIVFAPEQYLSNQFMFLWLKKYMSAVTNAANGSTFLEISKKAFKEIESIIPNEGVLQGFQSLIDPLFEKLKNNLIQIRTLTHLRDTLLPKLMKGEIRVSTQ